MKHPCYIPRYADPRRGTPWHCATCETPIPRGHGICGECLDVLAWRAAQGAAVPMTRNTAARMVRNLIKTGETVYTPDTPEAMVDAVWLASGARLVYAQRSRLVRPRIRSGRLLIEVAKDEPAFVRVVQSQGVNKRNQLPGLAECPMATQVKDGDYTLTQSDHQSRAKCRCRANLHAREDARYDH